MKDGSATASGASGVRALIDKGLACYGQGRVDHALQLWREVLAIDPANEEAHRLISVVQDRRVQAHDTGPQPADGGGNPSLEPTAEWMLPTNHVVGRDTPVPPRERRETPASGIPALLAKGTTPVPVPRASASEALRARDEAHRLRHQASTPVPPPASAPDVADAREFKESTRSNFAPIGTNTSFPPAAPEPVVDVLTRPIGTPGASSGRRTERGAGHPTQTFRTDTPLNLALATARTRALMLVDECRRSLAAGEVAKAAAAAEEALEEGDKAPMPGIAEVVAPAREMFSRAFEMHVGPEVGVPIMAVDISAASAASFDHRTGFLLSCIDGTLPVQTLLDIAGMGRFDSLRTLSGLLRRRIIAF